MYYLVPKDCPFDSVPTYGCHADELKGEEQAKELATFLYHLGATKTKMPIMGIQKVIEEKGEQGIREILNDRDQLVKTDVKFKDYSKPFNKVQKALTKDVPPSGRIYHFNLELLGGIPIEKKFQKLLGENGWRKEKNSLGMDVFYSVARSNIFQPDGVERPSHSDIAMQHVTCVLDDERADNFFYNLSQDKDYRMSMDIHDLGNAYPLDDLEYGFQLHKNAEVIRDWMKMQVDKSPAMSTVKLQRLFREECAIERPMELHAGDSNIYDFESRWAGMEIEEMVKRGELIRNTDRVDGKGYEWLENPKHKEVAWEDVSENHKGRFTLEKKKGTEVISVFQTPKGNYVAETVSNDFTKKGQELYRGKSLTAAMRTAEDYANGKQPKTTQR